MPPRSFYGATCAVPTRLVPRAHGACGEARVVVVAVGPPQQPPLVDPEPRDVEAELLG